MKRSTTSIGVVLFGLYLYSWSAAAIWFNFQSVRTNGLGEWLRFGEIVPTAQAFVWPYYAYERVADEMAPPSADPHLDFTPRADSIRRVLLAAAAATELLDSHPRTGPESLRVAHQLERLIDIPASTSATTLEWVYPGWSRAIHRDLVGGMRAFIALATRGRDGHATHEPRTRLADVTAHLTAYARWQDVNRLPLRQALEDCAIVAPSASGTRDATLP